MKISDIFEEIGDGDDLIEQLKYDIAVKVTTVYNTMKLVSNNFTLLPDKHTRGKTTANRYQNVPIQGRCY